VLLVALVAFCVSGSYAQNLQIGYFIKGNRSQVTVPFQVHNNLIVVDVILNEKLPLKFIVDTGLRTALLTDRLYTDMLDVNYSRTIPIVGADGNIIVDAYVVNNVTLGFRGFTGMGQTILALGEDFLELKNYMGIDVHGIIGYELFNRYIIQIDYDNLIMTFYEPGEFTPNRRFQALDMPIIGSKPYVHASVRQKNNQTVSGLFLLDTGASLAVSLDQEADDSIYIPEPKVNVSLGRAIGGDLEGALSRSNALNLGELQFKDVLTSYPDAGEYYDLLKVEGRIGSIGGNIFARSQVVFDYFSQKLYITKGKEYKRKFEYNMSGIEFKAEGNDLRTFVVKSILEDSPADHAGIQPGDRVISVNGTQARYFNLSQLAALMRSKEGRRIRFRLQRDEDTFNLNFRLRRII
jgi:predicted aspartyl protease